MSLELPEIPQGVREWAPEAAEAMRRGPRWRVHDDPRGHSREKLSRGSSYGHHPPQGRQKMKAGSPARTLVMGVVRRWSQM